MLVYFDPWMAGVVLPTMIIVGLVALPYIDLLTSLDELDALAMLGRRKRLASCA